MQKAEGGVPLRSVPAMWVPSTIFKHDTSPWVCTSSSQGCLVRSSHLVLFQRPVPVSHQALQPTAAFHSLGTAGELCCCGRVVGASLFGWTEQPCPSRQLQVEGQPCQGSQGQQRHWLLGEAGWSLLYLHLSLGAGQQREALRPPLHPQPALVIVRWW